MEKTYYRQVTYVDEDGNEKTGYLIPSQISETRRFDAIRENSIFYVGDCNLRDATFDSTFDSTWNELVEMLLDGHSTMRLSDDPSDPYFEIPQLIERTVEHE